MVGAFASYSQVHNYLRDSTPHTHVGGEKVLSYISPIPSRILAYIWTQLHMVIQWLVLAVDI